jgi:beta-alanine--pyruvate transaminase
MITAAKGLTNGSVPMGAVFVRKSIYDAFMQGPENAIELFHGYTYSSHPIACAASLATLYIYQHEGLLTRARELSRYWEDALHSLKGLPHIVDLRNYGLIAGIEFEPAPGRPKTRAFDAFLKCFERGILTRSTGDVLAMSPPLIVEKGHIDQLFGTLAEVVKTIE